MNPPPPGPPPVATPPVPDPEPDAPAKDAAAPGAPPDPEAAPVAVTGAVAASEAVLRGERRLAALRRSGLLDTPPEPQFDRVTAIAKRLVGVPHAQFSLITEDRQFVKSRQLDGEAPGAAREAPLTHSFCKYVVATGKTFAVADARTHPTVRDNPAVVTENVVAYLGVPVRSPDGEAVGALCAVDYRPRRWEVRDEQALRELASAVETELALRESEERYRAVVEGVRDVVFQTDGRWRLTFLNPAWTAVTGYTVEEGLGERLSRFLHPEDVARHQAALAGGAAHLREQFRFRTKGGADRWAEVHLTVLRDDGGRAVGSTGTLSDVTDAVRFQAEREARERTEELLRAKSAFLNNMSHELRTPLTGIIGFADVLAEEVPDDLREPVAVIKRSAERLYGTLAAVLDLAQLESGSVPLAPEAVDVLAEAEGARAAVAERARAKGIAVEVTGVPAHARADRAALRRVLEHLVGNAVKFTEHGGVAVHVARTAAGVTVRVADTGGGLPEGFAFEAFRQGSEGYARRHEGAGLGLTVAERLAALMGGSLAVASRPGQGATFTLTLPPAEG